MTPDDDRRARTRRLLDRERAVRLRVRHAQAPELRKVAWGLVLVLLLVETLALGALLIYGLRDHQTANAAGNAATEAQSAIAQTQVAQQRADAALIVSQVALARLGAESVGLCRAEQQTRREANRARAGLKRALDRAASLELMTGRHLSHGISRGVRAAARVQSALGRALREASDDLTFQRGPYCSILTAHPLAYRDPPPTRNPPR